MEKCANCHHDIVIDHANYEFGGTEMFLHQTDGKIALASIPIFTESGSISLLKRTIDCGIKGCKCMKPMMSKKAFDKIAKTLNSKDIMQLRKQM